MIWEVLTISAVFMVIGGMKVFDQIWLMTSQEPTTKTHVIGTLMVSTMFGEFKVGEATAIAVICSCWCLRDHRRHAVDETGTLGTLTPWPSQPH